MARQFEMIALKIAIPIILRCQKDSPERCARNLMDFGERIQVHSSIEEKEEIYERFWYLCRNGSQQQIMDYFFTVYK